MTFDELLAATADRRIIRHQFKTFFCVYDPIEASRFKSLGANIRPAGGHPDPLTGKVEWGQPCWEVFLAGMLDPMVEVIDDEEVDVREEFLLNHFRDRDGFYEGALAR